MLHSPSTCSVRARPWHDILTLFTTLRRITSRLLPMVWTCGPRWDNIGNLYHNRKPNLPPLFLNRHLLEVGRRVKVAIPDWSHSPLPAICQQSTSMWPHPINIRSAGERPWTWLQLQVWNRTRVRRMDRMRHRKWCEDRLRHRDGPVIISCTRIRNRMRHRKWSKRRLRQDGLVIASWRVWKVWFR